MLGLRAGTRGGGADSGLRASPSLPGTESWLLAPLTRPLPSAQGPGCPRPNLPTSASPSCATQSFWLHWPFATWPLGFSLSSCGLVQFAGRVHCGLFQKPLPCSPGSAVRPQPLGAGASSCCVFLSIRTSYFNFLNGNAAACLKVAKEPKT